MARWKSLMLVAVIVFAFGTFLPAARSDCESPRLTITRGPPRAPGDSLVVRGNAWTGDCNDTVTCSCLGCSGDEPPRPATDIVVSLREVGDAGEGTVLIEGIDADADLEFTAKVTVPDVPKGRYQLVGTSDSIPGFQSVGEPFRITN